MKNKCHEKSAENIIKEISDNLLKATQQYIGQENNTNTKNAIKETIVNYVCDKPLEKITAQIKIND